jgi:tetratricopeptide (TPR) repeat protein
MVLGKILVYEGSFETAEYYLRRSLLLNRNDPETISQVATSLVYLGFIDEAKELYERVLLLDPLNKRRYYSIGSFIYFEAGDFKTAATLAIQSTGAKFADTDAYYAAMYYFLDEKEKMEDHWNKFLETYKVQHVQLKEHSARGAIEWLFQINPHRHASKLEPFLEYITSGSLDRKEQRPVNKNNETPLSNLFARQVVGWKLAYDGLTVLLPEVKGFFDIQKLITEPGRLFHCGELMGNAIEQKGEKVFDAKARQHYQQKILDLQKELSEAEKNNDLGRFEKLQVEYDQLLDHLSKSLTLKGKIRQSSHPVEKARSAVTWRIRNAIARIEQSHPVLGAHLSNAINTGTFCSYKPEKPVQWLEEELF